MEHETIIQTAVQRQSTTLTEADSKTVLKAYGVPVAAEWIALTESEAVSRAEESGFPVVLKALGERLAHKTERRLVALDIRSAGEVREAFGRIRALAGDDWEACLVQTMIRGTREFAAGFFRDPQFGPVVMFGLGGIFAEALDDVVFRFPPLRDAQIHDMIDALACKSLLADFRGEAAVDPDQLVQTLNGLSRLGMAHPEIREVDINPLILTPEGNLVAVDALIAIDSSDRDAGGAGLPGGDPAAADACIQRAIDQMVHPRSIAVVGAKREGGKSLSGGDMFKRLQDFGFPGKLYPVNPHAGETIRGCKAYPDLQSLPEVPDHVIISVPARYVPGALRDCAAVGSKNIHIFAAGFKETGDAEGLRLQAEIEDIARRGGLHVIGPNCMGLYVPESKMVTWPEAPAQSGPVAFISQSGGHARDFTKFASSRLGIHFSTVVSYGNALTLDCVDFLKYVAQDDRTRVILMYLEGIADGRALFEAVRQTSREKPVIIFKAGMTDAGVRIAASHTGALAGSEKLWHAFFQQSGAVRATSLEAMAGLTEAFLHLGDCPGRRIAVLGSGGGISVNAADACTGSGLILPALSPRLFEMVGDTQPNAGTIVSNPIDAHKLFFDLPLLGRMLAYLSDGAHVDMFIIFLQLDWLYTDSGRSEDYMQKLATYIGTEGKRFAGGRPLVVAWRQYLDIPEVQRLTRRIQRILLDLGVPVYEGMPGAVSALSTLAAYHEFRRQG